MFAFLSSGTELRRFGKGTMPKIALVVLMFIPLIYGALYLWAFWAPDTEMKNLPVALVNTDSGATLDGKALNAGDDLKDELVDGHKLGWKVTNAKDAAAGVRAGDYYFSVTIPHDFSADAVSAGTETPSQARITVDYNDSNGFLASTMGKQAMVQLRDAVATKIGDQTVSALLVGVSDAGDGIRSAADGAASLADGVGEAKTGAGTLTVGLDSLAAGAVTLDGGAARLADGATTLQQGLGALTTGANSLSTSSVQLADGTRRVSDGVNAASAGAASLSTTSVRLADGADGIATGAGKLGGGTESLSTSLQELQSQMEQAPPGTDAKVFLPALNKIKSGAADLDAKAQSATTQTRDYAGSSRQFSAGVGELSGTLAAGAPGAAQVSTGAEQLSAGAASVASGASTASTGAQKLAAGSTELSAGAGSLVDGSSQLADGGTQLRDGTTELADGSRTLSDRLASGGTRAPDMSQAELDKTARVIASPVALDQNWENATSSFGEGFAPMFLFLAAFVGALITWTVLRALPTRALASGASGLRATMTGFLPAAAIALAQVVIMMLVLVYGIGLKPEYWLAMSAFLYLAALALLGLLQMLIILFGSAAGRVLSLVFMMLQLTSSGGTYPIETTPAFFQAIHPFLPATYVVTGLRELITGGVDSRLWVSVAVLAVVLVGSLSVSAWRASRQRMWTITRLHPELTI